MMTQFDINRGIFFLQIQVQVQVNFNQRIYMINMHCSQLAKASRGEQWLQVYKRENE